MWNKIKTVLSDIFCIALLIICVIFVYIVAPALLVCAAIGIASLPFWIAAICYPLLFIVIIVYIGLLACFWLSGKESENDYKRKDN